MGEVSLVVKAYQDKFCELLKKMMLNQELF